MNRWRAWRVLAATGAIGLALVLAIGRCSDVPRGASDRASDGPPNTPGAAAPADARVPLAAPPPTTPGEPHPPGPADTAATLGRRVRVRGAVRDRDGRALPAVVEVSGVGSAARSSVELRADARGEFGGELQVDASCSAVCAVAASVVDAAPVVSQARRRRLEPAEREIDWDLVLVLRPGARITGRIPRGTEEDASLSTTRVLVSELPTGSAEAPSSWDRAGPAAVDRFLVPSDDGTFQLTVRPGDFRVRCVARDGRAGRTVSGTVAAGEVAQLGVLPAPGGGATFQVTVVDEAGAPIPDAWIALDDRMVPITSGTGSADAPHFVADATGRILVENVPRVDLPMGGAIGARGFTAQSIVLDDAALEPRIVLRERPRLPIRLVGASAAEMLSTRAAPLVAACALIDGSGTIEALARRDLADRLSRVRYEPRVAVIDATRGLAAVERPPDGTYELSLRLGSVVVARAPVVPVPSQARSAQIP